MTAAGLLIGCFIELRPARAVSPEPSAQAGQSQTGQSQAGSDGTFQATPAQLAGFQIETVVARTFHSLRSTDGKIGLDLDRTTPVFSPYSGRVVRVMANPGERVRRGQPLMAVEATEFVQGQNDLIGAAATLASARAQLAQARLNEQRKHGLFEARAGAQQDWQQARTDLSAAVSTERSAEVALTMVRNRLRILGKSDAEIDRLENAQRIDPVANVVAPIDGTVTDRQVGPGQYIQSGSGNPQFSIGDLSTVWLIANVRETDAPLMKIGEPLQVRVLALPDRTFDARITYVAASIDPATRRLAVRAEIANPDGLLKPEMFASFRITTGDERTSPAVPAGAIVYEGAQARVWVAGDGGRIGLREIRPGRSDGGMVEVLDGLKPGERVVTSGTLFIDRAVKRAMEEQVPGAATAQR